jgi:hypothetical protein
MTFLKSIYADLVERRLWPLAAALLVALVAVPVVLSRPGKEDASTAGPSAQSSLLGRDAASLLGETKAVVTAPGEGGFRKHVGRLARKNPFVQQARKPPASAEGLTPTGQGGGAAPTTGQEPLGTPGTGAPTAPTEPGSQPLKLFQYFVEVKFGKIGKTSKKTVQGGDFLPSQENPVVLSVGASDDGQNALFLVSAEVTARGDGECVPSESDCQVVEMKKNDVQFFEVAESAETVTTYELEVVDIELREVKNSSTAQRNERRLQQLRSSSRQLQRMRRAMRVKKVFKALDELSF